MSGMRAGPANGRIGEPTQARRVIQQFHDALDQAGIRRVRFHDLHHSCATLLLVQGVSARVVMEVLGHSEIALTMNAYSHVVPELQQEAAQRMQAILER
jgi:integrase